MAVTVATIAGVPVYQFSGAVTDAEIKAAWSALIVNGTYAITRAIYLDNTADMTGVTGGFMVNMGTQVLPAIILHTGRDKTKSTFNNFTFLQSQGITVINRFKFVQLYNGTTLSDAGGGTSNDGLAMNGGGFIYGAAGNQGSGNGRYLNEMPFASFEGVTIYSQEFTEQELQPCVGASTTLKGVAFEKAYGFPQLGTPFGNVNVVVYRSKQNTQSATDYPLRSFPSGGRWGSLCYVDSYVTRNNADITTRLMDSFGANASNRVVVMILNNYTRESWFGASKTTFNTMGNWNAANEIWGGVLKKLQFINGDGGVVRCYDSRSITTSQKSAFAETGTVDFLNASVAPTTDGTGKISLVHIAALSTGAGPSPAITRYTGQKYTFQKFGYRVLIGTPDMTSGDNDLSAFSPISLTEQSGISRTQVAITADTTIDNFQELLEELHVLAIGLSGAQSYNGAYTGNLFEYDGAKLTTAFTTVNVDATAASKIAYNSATNTLTIKSSVLTSNSVVTSWSNATGTINLLNAAVIQGVYTTSAGTSTIWSFGVTGEPVIAGTSLAIYTSAGVTKYFNAVTVDGVYNYYIAPQAVGETYTYAIERYGYKREEGTFPSNAGGNLFYVPSYGEDVGITESTLATVQAYTTITNSEQFFDYTANFRLTETGIKKGNIVNRDGTNINITGFNHVIKNNATSIYAIVGDTITTKGASYEGTTKYIKEVTDFSHTIEADTTEIITILIEDANGDSSAFLQGTANDLVEVWKIPNTTLPKDFETGILLDSGIGNGAYRFLSEDGFKLVFNNTDLGIVFRYCSMSKGDYRLGWYIYNEATGGLTDEQSLLLNNIYDKEVIIQNKLDTDLDVAVSTRLADVDYIDPATAQDVWEYTTRTLTSAGASGATLAEIEASTILAKEATSQEIKTKVLSLENYDDASLQTKVDNLPTLAEMQHPDSNIAKQDSLITLSSLATSTDNTVGLIIDKVDTLENYDDATTQTKLDALQTSVDNINVDFTPVLDAIDTLPTLTEIEAGKVGEIKTKVDTLENTDLTGVQDDLTIINNGVKRASKLIPHNTDL